MPHKRKRPGDRRPTGTGAARSATPPAGERQARQTPRRGGTAGMGSAGSHSGQSARAPGQTTPAPATGAVRLLALARRLGVVGWLVVGAIVLIGACTALNFAATATAPVVDGMRCELAEGQVRHYHAELFIYVNGRQVPLPEGIGIRQTCLYAVHTHDASGLVHIESPTVRTYTLGNLFALWGQPLSQSRLLDHPVDSAHPLVVVTFDARGRPTTVTGDPRQIIFTAHETIYLLYNSPNVTPTPYTHWGEY